MAGLESNPQVSNRVQDQDASDPVPIRALWNLRTDIVFKGVWCALRCRGR